MRTKKWFSGLALIALLLSVAVAQGYPESSQRKGVRVGSSSQGKRRSGVSDNWSGVTLRKLKILTEQDGITVEITATRPVTPTLTRLSFPDRLVLDFPNTLSGSHQNVVAVNHGGVKSVRIGVQSSDPPMTRLVVDLLQPQTSELATIGDTIVLKLRSLGNAREKTAIDSAVEAAAVLDPPFSHSRVDSNPSYLAGVTFKPTESREDHGSQLSAKVQESADPPTQPQDSNRNSSATRSSGTTASSGQEVSQQMPAGGPPTPAKPEPQQAVNQVLPATGKVAEPATSANGSNGTLSSPAAGGEMKAAPTNQALSNTSAGSPAVQETADPPAQAEDSSRNSSATGGPGTTASSGQEVGQQMPLEEGGSGNQGTVQGTDLHRLLNQAEAGDSNAQDEMAVRYADGKGVPQNHRQAMAWFAKAAANGNADAQWKLGLAYLKGIAVPQDEHKAAEWFKTAANQGHIGAQSALSDIYFDGRGVPRDYVRAYTWASIAAGLRGNDSDRLKVIRSRMTAVQIEDARRRISSWWERQRAKTIESRPTNSTIAASGTSEGAHRGQSSEAPASADLVQEPIQSSTLGGWSGSEPANPVIPVSHVAFLADSVPRDAKDTKITTSQNDPATRPQVAPQAPQQEQQQQATPGNQPSQTDTPPEKITTSQNVPVTPPQTAPQAQKQEQQQQAAPGNQSSQPNTPTASSEQDAAVAIQQPANVPAQSNNELEPAKPSTPNTKITESQNAPVTPPPQTALYAQQQEQQQAIPGNQSSPPDTPTASSEQNAAATIQRPANAPAASNDEPEPAKASTSDTKITSGQNLPATQLEQQQDTPRSQSGQTETPTPSSEQNAGVTIQQPANAPAKTNDEPDPGKPLPMDGGSVSAAANSSLTPMAAPPLNTADVTGTVDRPKQQPRPDEYVIGEQDVLNITVWRERELSGSVVVRPDGKITLPLVDDIKVVGLTPAQLRAVLVDKLKPFVTIAQVTVAVSQINSRKVYLIGEVGKTGTFPINSSTTVLQLLAQAGGVKDFAKRKAIYILRNEQGKQVRHRFNYDEVIRGKNSEQNIFLQPADTIVVP